MKLFFRRFWILFLYFGIASGCSTEKKIASPGQNPSPMTESIRPHERVSADDCQGKRIQWELADKKVQLFIPDGLDSEAAIDLVIHFHGLPAISEFAICGSSSRVMLTVNGGSGGGSYERVFEGGKNFQELLERARRELNIEEFASITLSGWSAGYGAIRALLRDRADLIDGVILLDGLHTSYIPEGRVLYLGGTLDTTSLEPFYQYAMKALAGQKRMVITHTSIFPGTYASTTECTEYLIKRLGLERKAVLKSGPVGSQQVGEVVAGKLQILSFAGNTAPDHVDHLHGLGFFLDLLDEMGMKE